jgi:hypothetical protein
MITGEERLRELLGALYGDVTGWEGRPADYQVKRTDALARELEDVATDFRKLVDKDLPGINPGLKKKKLETIQVPDEDQWKNQHQGQSASGTTATRGFREAD